MRSNSTETDLLVGSLDERSRTPKHDWVVAAGFFIYMDSDNPDTIFSHESYPLTQFKDFLLSMFGDLTEYQHDLEIYVNRSFTFSTPGDEWEMVNAVFTLFKKMKEFQREVIDTVETFAAADFFSFYPRLQDACSFIATLWWDHVDFDFCYFLTMVASYVLQRREIEFDKAPFSYLDNDPSLQEIRDRIRLEIIDMHRPSMRSTTIRNYDYDSIRDGYSDDDEGEAVWKRCQHGTKVLVDREYNIWECQFCHARLTS